MTIGISQDVLGRLRARHVEARRAVVGLIVAHEGNPQLHYAVSAVPGLSFMVCEVGFRLKQGLTFDEIARP